MTSIAKRSHLFIYATLAACILISASVYLMRQPAAQPPAVNGVFLTTPTPVAPFTLHATTGRDFTLESLKQHWSFVFIGFASCPDVCPTTLGVFERMFERLQKAPGIVMPQFVFVSVDPQRDTLPKLAEYVHKFNPAFIGATGDEAQLQTLATSLSMSYEKMYNSDKTAYAFNHSTSVALINPKGELQAVFTVPLQAEDIAKNYKAIIKYVAAHPVNSQ